MISINILLNKYKIMLTLKQKIHKNVFNTITKIYDIFVTIIRINQTNNILSSRFIVRWHERCLGIFQNLRAADLVNICLRLNDETAIPNAARAATDPWMARSPECFDNELTCNRKANREREKISIIFSKFQPRVCRPTK
jgi:hypothetical protein